MSLPSRRASNRKMPHCSRVGSDVSVGRKISFFVGIALLAITCTDLTEYESSQPVDTNVTQEYKDGRKLPETDTATRGYSGTHIEETVDDYEDFFLEVLPSTIVSHQVSSKETTIETDEYRLTVDWSQSGWVDYRIELTYTTDFIRYRRVKPDYPMEGSIDEFGNRLDNVSMTVASWGLQGNVAWFLESCPEFSLNQTFTFFRDYMELNVTYLPGTKNALTTYFVALFSESDNIYDMFDGGYHRYMPGAAKDPRGFGMGGWYPTYGMFAPAIDMRVPYGNMGVEWGYSDTVAYIYSPVWMSDIWGSGGYSAYALKYSSLNSIVPNIGLGTPETFHMFIRPYQYSDGEERGFDVGYAQWVAEKIVDEWGYHDIDVFPLTVMHASSWTSEFADWVESSQVKVATYSSNLDQINWNYMSAWRRNHEPKDDPSIIPDDWELWGPGNQPQYVDNDVILNPVSGTYKDVGSYRHHLIEDYPYNDWWWSSDGVFWDEMNTFTPWVKPRNDYHNRSEFIYEGYLKLVQETYESGHWNFTITNPYTALLHLSMVSDLTVIESYRASSFSGVDFTGHANSTMMLVNNIPEQYRPNILVYQYYDATDNPADQEDVYRFLFGSARYGFHAAPASWSDLSYQIHNLEMAEKMYLAMGASRDEGIQIQAATLDLDEKSTINTSSRVIVWTGDRYTPNIASANEEPSYCFTNLRGADTTFGVSINTNKYYVSNSSSITGHMTYLPNGKAWFNGTIEAEETEYILRLDSFQVEHQERGSVEVELFSLNETEARFSISSVEGDTRFTIYNLLPETEYALYLDGRKERVNVSDVKGQLTFVVSPDGNRMAYLMLGSSPPPPDTSTETPTDWTIFIVAILAVAILIIAIPIIILRRRKTSKNLPAEQDSHGFEETPPPKS